MATAHANGARGTGDPHDDAAGRPAAGVRGRILVVEDDIDALDLIAHLVERAGYAALRAPGGVEALDLLRENEVDVVLLDVMMPGVDGLEVCRRLKASEATAGLPIVLLTALDDMETRAAGMKLGVSEFLTKPINVDELERRLETQVGVRRRAAEFERVGRRLDELEG